MSHKMKRFLVCASFVLILTVCAFPGGAIAKDSKEFQPVGMVEVSSCIIDDNIKQGYHVTKGEYLGYFQFGGSTHCLIFRPGVIKEFTVKTGKPCKVGEHIATAH